MLDKCPICLNSDVQVSRPAGGHLAYDIECKRCGNYRISETAASMYLKNYGPLYLLSAAIRNRFEREGRIELSTRTFETLLDSVSKPSDPIETIDLLLQHIFRKTGKISKSVVFTENDYPLLFAEDVNEFYHYLKLAEKLNLIEPKIIDTSEREYYLTLEGWKRIFELKKNEIKLRQAFVAMWFDSNLDDAWENGFRSALLECGYDQPIRIDLQEHNEKICDKIIAEIRQSGLVVADFTGQRGGVYFEAGFALGLGKQVIWTCRADHIKDLHFDTRQYNHIVWQTSEELKEKLVNRIIATVTNMPLK